MAFCSHSRFLRESFYLKRGLAMFNERFKRVIATTLIFGILISGNGTITLASSVEGMVKETTIEEQQNQTKNYYYMYEEQYYEESTTIINHAE